MALFEFSLWPIEKLSLFTNSSNQTERLHWFGLTDGIYHMNVGDQQLFRFTPAILEHWKKQYPDVDSDTPYADYQVVRLYEDVLELLPDIMQPIPRELHEYISTKEKQDYWDSKLDTMLQTAKTEDEEDLVFEATTWRNQRSLDSSHLAMGPEILIWRFEGDVYIRWSVKANTTEGIQYWTSEGGDFKLTASNFISEIEDFHDRLMAAMTERVQTIKNNSPIPHVNSGIPELIIEHEERKGSLKRALATPATISEWGEIIELNRDLLVS